MKKMSGVCREIAKISDFSRLAGFFTLVASFAGVHLAAQPWSVSSPGSSLVIEVKQDVVVAIAPNQKNCTSGFCSMAGR